MIIYIAFKHYRQVNGEYTAVQVEKGFSRREDAESFLQGKPRVWQEKREVPLVQGGTMPVEFQGMWAVHECELDGA